MSGATPMISSAEATSPSGFSPKPSSRVRSSCWGWIDDREHDRAQDVDAVGRRPDRPRRAQRAPQPEARGRGEPLAPRREGEGDDHERQRQRQLQRQPRAERLPRRVLRGRLEPHRRWARARAWLRHRRRPRPHRRRPRPPGRPPGPGLRRRCRSVAAFVSPPPSAAQQLDLVEPSVAAATTASPSRRPPPSALTPSSSSRVAPGRHPASFSAVGDDAAVAHAGDDLGAAIVVQVHEGDGLGDCRRGRCGRARAGRAVPGS